MQPVSPLERPGRMPLIRYVARTAIAITLALGAATVPLREVAACSCVFAGYQEAIAAADVAFIGTVVAESEPPPGGMMAARYAFDVRLSKEPMPSPYEIDSTFGNGANCGLDMAIGDEWLVIASEWEGRLETNLCTGTTRTVDLDPGELARIEDALPPNESTFAPDEHWSPIDIPAPVVGIIAAALLITAVGFLAFRRDRVT